MTRKTPRTGPKRTSGTAQWPWHLPASSLHSTAASARRIWRESVSGSTSARRFHSRPLHSLSWASVWVSISRQERMCENILLTTYLPTGPLVFAPLSEIFGRQPVYIGTLALAVIFVIPCAVAQNIGTLLVCRLIDGI